jgi:hypothetical protein
LFRIITICHHGTSLFAKALLIPGDFELIRPFLEGSPIRRFSPSSSGLEASVGIFSSPVTISHAFIVVSMVLALILHWM